MLSAGVTQGSDPGGSRGMRPNLHPVHPANQREGGGEGERSRYLKEVGSPYKSPGIESSEQETRLDGFPEPQ